MTRTARYALACWLTAASVATAAAVGVIASGRGHDVRHLLGLRFGGVPHTPAEAARIATHNGWLAALAVAAAAIVPHVPESARRFLDASLASLLLVNAGAVGLAVGAYGHRALIALAPHTPIEFAALALSGGAYMHARKHAVPTGTLAVCTLVCALLLAGAATVETYVSTPGAPA